MQHPKLEKLQGIEAFFQKDIAGRMDQKVDDKISMLQLFHVEYYNV
jgi:hypothetical protein